MSNMHLCRLFLSIIFLAVVGTLPTTKAAIPGDIRYNHKPSPEDAPHMAYLLTASRINYPNLAKAEDDLSGIKDGRLSFLEALRRQQDYNKRHSRNKEPHFSGDLGLLSYDQLDPATSKILFDIRNPLAGSTANSIIGPVCGDEYGCSLYIVYQRFRRSFFSPAWLEADEFCMKNDIDFGQFLQGLGNNDNRAIAARIWPDDIATFQRIKLSQVSADLKRMKDGDPSTTMPKRKPRNNAILEAHQKRLAEREAFFSLVVTKELTSQHPEIYAMELPELANSGLISRELLIEKGLGAYLNNYNTLQENTTDSQSASEKQQDETAPQADQVECGAHGGDCPIDLKKIRAEPINESPGEKKSTPENEVQQEDDLDEF